MNHAFTKLQHNFFLILFIGVGIVMFFIYRPFLNSLIIAGSLAVVFHPLYKRVTRAVRGKKTVASILTVFIILLLVLAPLVLIGSLLFDEVRSLYISLAITNDFGLAGLVSVVEGRLHLVAPDIQLDAARYVQTSLQWLFTHLDSFFSGFLSILITVFVMVVALFFLLKDGAALRDKFFVLSPLDRKYDETIFSKIVLAINSVIKGSIVIGIVQGIFAGFGFWVAGVPNPIIWGVAAMLASLIPGIGTSLITVPCILYLLFTQPLWQGIILLVWAVFGIGLIDNFMAPLVLKRSMKIHPLLILMAVLGGVTFFGPIGFIMGPVMLAFFFALLDIYPLIIQES